MNDIINKLKNKINEIDIEVDDLIPFVDDNTTIIEKIEKILRYINLDNNYISIIYSKDFQELIENSNLNTDNDYIRGLKLIFENNEVFVLKSTYGKRNKIDKINISDSYLKKILDENMEKAIDKMVLELENERKRKLREKALREIYIRIENNTLVEDE